MKYFWSLLPANTPERVARSGELAILRERILQTILLIFLALGSVAYILATRGAILNKDPYLPLIYSAIFLTLLVTVLSRSWSYGARGFIATTLVYLLGVSELIESGSLGDLRMFLIAYVTLVAVLFQYRHMTYALLGSMATIAAAGLHASIVETPLFPALARINEGTNWVISLVMFVLLSLTTGGSAIALISGLQANLRKQAELARSLANERDTLEDRIQERTLSISRRLVQLHTAADVSRSISALNAPETLIQQVVDLIHERFDLYYVGVFLLDSQNQYAVLQSGTGEAGRRMVADHHRLPVGGSSMIGRTISSRKARIALDVGTEAVRYNNPNLPLTRSEMALPIMARETVLGAMTIQSDRPNAFDENDVAVLQGIADSLGTALENDRLFKETRQNLEEIRVLNREYLQRTWSETINLHGELAYTFENPMAPSQQAEGATIEVPVSLRNEVIGYLSLETGHNVLSAEEQAFIENITNQTAIALENARLLEKTVQRADREKKVMEITARIRSSNDPERMMQIAVDELQRALGASRAQIYVRRREQNAAYPIPPEQSNGGAKPDGSNGHH